MQAGCGGSFFYYQPSGSRGHLVYITKVPGQPGLHRHSLKKQKSNKRLTGDTDEARRLALLPE